MADVLFVLGVVIAGVAGWRQWRAGVLEHSANDAVMAECREFIERAGARMFKA